MIDSPLSSSGSDSSTAAPTSAAEADSLVRRVGSLLLVAAIASAVAGAVRIFTYPQKPTPAGATTPGPTHHGTIIVGTTDSYDGE